MASTVPNFKDLERSNFRKTIGLLVALAVLLTGVVVGAGYYLGYDPAFIVAFALIFSLFGTVGAYWKSDTLVLTLTHAKIVSPEDGGKLYNLVEEMAIAAGIKVPKVAIVNDSAPNAFATGRDEEHAVIAFTSGILDKMNREELQAVTAHEMAHIKNRDTLVNTVAAVTAGLIALIVDIAIRFGLRSRGRNSGPFVLIGALLALILAPIAAGLLKAAISRRREALADATAVAFTRNPTGLRQALEVLRDDSTVVKSNSNAIAHMWIESPLAPGKMSRLFDTHPPIQQRIDTLRAMEGLS